MTVQLIGLFYGRCVRKFNYGDERKDFVSVLKTESDGCARVLLGKTLTPSREWAGRDYGTGKNASWPLSSPLLKERLQATREDVGWAYIRLS